MNRSPVLNHLNFLNGWNDWNWSLYLLGVGYLQIFANLSGEIFVNLPVPWYGGNFSCFSIYVDTMVAALAYEFGTVAFEVADQVDPLH